MTTKSSPKTEDEAARVGAPVEPEDTSNKPSNIKDRKAADKVPAPGSDTTEHGENDPQGDGAGSVQPNRRIDDGTADHERVGTEVPVARAGAGDPGGPPAVVQPGMVSPTPDIPEPEGMIVGVDGALHASPHSRENEDLVT